MDRINIFEDSIILSSFFNPEVDEKILKIIEKEELDNNKVVKSNVGGFQSNFINDEKICRSLLAKASSILAKSYSYKKKTTFSLCNLWINKNFKDNYNKIHVHPNCHFSGVYYLKYPKGSGRIVFHRNDSAATFNGAVDYVEDSNFKSHIEIEPKEKTLIIFPAHLNHSVESSKSEETRISVAFNVNLIDG